MTGPETPSRRGKHRILTDEDERLLRASARADVPADIHDAIAQMLNRHDEGYEPDDWTFERSKFLGWVAHRRHPRTAHNVLCISRDCRTRWLEDGAAQSEALADLERDTSLSRAHIEYLLSDANPFYRGTWHLLHVPDRGWVCTRSAWGGRTKTFLVALNHRVARERDQDPKRVLAALKALSTLPSVSTVSDEATPALA
jgi:hypothetical protein